MPAEQQVCLRKRPWRLRTPSPDSLTLGPTLTLAEGNATRHSGIGTGANCVGAVTSPRSSLERTNFEGFPLAAKIPEVVALIMKSFQCRAIGSNAKWVVLKVGEV